MSSRRSESKEKQLLTGRVAKFFKLLSFISRSIVSVWIIIIIIRLFLGDSIDLKIEWITLFLALVGISINLPQGALALVQWLRDPSLPFSTKIQNKVVRPVLKVIWRFNVVRLKETEIWGRPGYLSDQYFIDVEDFLAEIHSALYNVLPINRSVLAIAGASGSGKTQNVFAYATRYRENYSWILWINASSLEDIVSSCENILDEAKSNQQSQGILPGTQGGSTDPIARLKHWLRVNKHLWLLILDRCSNLSNCQPELRIVLEEFIACAQYGYVLMTTTELDIAGHPNTRSLSLPKWTENEGAQFLLRRIYPVDRNAKVARQISKELDNFPLALEFAAITIIESRKSLNLSTYLDKYVSKRKEILRTPLNHAPRGFPNTLPAALLVFFEEVRHSPVRDLLKMCALLAPAPIPREIIITAMNTEASQISSLEQISSIIDDAIGMLNDFPFVESTLDTITMRPLMQMIIQDEIDETTQRDWLRSTMAAVHQSLKSKNIENWQDRQRIQLYLPHALKCAEYIEKFQEDSYIRDKEALELLITTGYYLQEFAHYKEAENILIQAEKLCQSMLDNKQLSNPSREKADCLRYQADLYHTQGRCEKAKKCYDASLTIYGDDLNSAIVENALGWLYDDWADITSGLDTDARTHYDKALDLWKKVCPHQNDTNKGLRHYCMSTKSNLAWIYYKNGDHAKAKDLLTQIEKYLGSGSQGRGDTSRQTGPEPYWYTYEKIFKGILEVSRDACGDIADCHPHIADCHTHLAVLYTLHGQYLQAQMRFIEAADIDERYFGKDRNHPYIARRLNNQAELYRRRGEFEKAEDCLQQARDICKQTLGESHPLMASLLTNLSGLCRSKGNAEKAADYKEQAEEIRKQAGEKAGTMPPAKEKAESVTNTDVSQKQDVPDDSLLLSGKEGSHQ